LVQPSAACENNPKTDLDKAAGTTVRAAGSSVFSAYTPYIKSRSSPVICKRGNIGQPSTPFAT
jgi:hypothetical protein